MARILICDDSNLSRSALRRIIHTSGHTVVGEAVDGEEACQKFSELKPDLVTMDITMPKMNGIKALQAILQRDTQAKVVMISALGHAAKILEAVHHGAKCYVTKPFDENAVRTAIDDALNA
ncbi:response regulator [Heliophilum fasciatum]|uniref:Stage 0 sporulation protein A homolog n=1 Tax=Heliophilum fasciatum TaxID=35700 RepID=A0A4R2S955_9FIRM|nr:response regulator [Heliophilum fasciatum]MCW2276668.1 two-component system chemotaxis response regulator CheY [Heliophilum fasciatum]TCP68951.1 two-component system chemotaxis response regulator CheY [Heliophilum fasciatum]